MLDKPHAIGRERTARISCQDCRGRLNPLGQKHVLEKVMSAMGVDQDGQDNDDLAASRAETLSVFLRWSTRAIVAIALVLILMALTLL